MIKITKIESTPSEIKRGFPRIAYQLHLQILSIRINLGFDGIYATIQVRYKGDKKGGNIIYMPFFRPLQLSVDIYSRIEGPPEDGTGYPIAYDYDRVLKLKDIWGKSPKEIAQYIKGRFS